LSIVRVPKTSAFDSIQMADFVFSLSESSPTTNEFKVIKNRRGPPGDKDDKSVYDFMVTSFTEAAYNYLLKNKTEVIFFENCVKDQFKQDLIKFVEDKWREINEDRMSKELKTR
jgi:hypothetical protein